MAKIRDATEHVIFTVMRLFPRVLTQQLLSSCETKTLSKMDQ